MDLASDKQFKPEIVVLDYETALLNGTPSVDFYRDDFRAITAAFAWRKPDGTVGTLYLVGEDAIGEKIGQIRGQGIPVVVHNYQFEYGVTACRFPANESAISIDTMRLTQVTDNGGREAFIAHAPLTYEQQLDAIESKEEDNTPFHPGLSLVACVSRHCPPEYHEHKEPYYSLIRERTGCKTGDEGKNLNSLTPDELEKYNVADAVVTLVLYESLCKKLKERKYDWRLDHMLYAGSAQDIAKAKIMGVPVDREALKTYQVDLEKEILDIEEKFREHFIRQIREIEVEKEFEFINALKTVKGRANRSRQIHDDPDMCRLNVGSNKQLAALFVHKLKMTPKFWTAEGKASKAKRAKNPDAKEFVPSPSFKAAHLHTWGIGGDMLVKRRKRMLVLSQVKSLLELSELDGKWHVDLKACGTTTGRFAGGRV